MYLWFYNYSFFSEEESVIVFKKKRKEKESVINYVTQILKNIISLKANDPKIFN